ncbi:MAG: hypothetical protein ACWGHH_02525 [Sulfurovaceae bacterium]
MKLSKRIKQIAILTVDDFYSSGYSSSENAQSLKSWLVEDILKIDGIEDLHTYQISILILDKLKALDIVDLEYIHSVVLKRYTQPSKVSITFDEKVL